MKYPISEIEFQVEYSASKDGLFKYGKVLAPLFKLSLTEMVDSLKGSGRYPRLRTENLEEAKNFFKSLQDGELEFTVAQNVTYEKYPDTERNSWSYCGCETDSYEKMSGEFSTFFSNYQRERDFIAKDELRPTFRPHRGGLQESINDSFKVSCLDEIIKELNKTAIFPLDSSKAEIKYYGYDDRIQQDCFIVTVKDYGVLGFVNHLIPKDLTDPKAIEECNNYVPQRKSPIY